MAKKQATATKDKRKVTMWLSHDVMKKIKATAIREDRSQAYVVERMLSAATRKEKLDASVFG